MTAAKDAGSTIDDPGGGGASRIQDSTLQLLGIAKKAGLLAIGGDSVSAAARAGKTRLIITAGDASEGALRRARSAAGAGGAPHIPVPYTMFELGRVSGRGSPGIVAFLDAGLAAAFTRGLAKAEPERYSGAAEQLEANARALDEKKKRTQRRTEQ